MPGLIETIADRGVERKDLLQGVHGGKVGGENFSYSPKDLASIISLVNGKSPKAKTMLCIEHNTLGARFIAENTGVDCTFLGPEKPDTFLRGLKATFDVISIDSRKLDMTGEEVWKFVMGGKEERKGFGKGAPKNYGTGKLNPVALVIVNCLAQDCKDLWFNLRSKYERVFQSNFAIMCKIGK